MGKYYKISFIGSGNLAWHLAPAFENEGHSVIEVYSRNKSNAEKLCSKLYEASVKNDLNFHDSEPDIIILSVSDKALPFVLEEISIPPKSIIAHTSGTESVEIFSSYFKNYGVLYPVQTFSKVRNVDFQHIPISIEGSDGQTEEVLSKLAASLSGKVFSHSTPQRRVVHLASVFAANFTNHMYTIAKGLLESNGLEFDLVKPLIEEVVNKAFEIGPENAQTGPAIRNDINTIKKHLNYLSEEKDLTEIYQSITENIIKTYEE